MIDDLVKRLRDSCYLAFDDGTNDYVSAEQAADRIEKLEAALRTVEEWHGCGLPTETTRMIDAALEGKNE